MSHPPHPPPDSRSPQGAGEPLAALRERVAVLERENRSLTERSDRLEDEVAALANVCVAGEQLHATLDLTRVLGLLRELLQQLVGARQFVVYLVDPQAQELQPVVHDNVEPTRFPSLSLSATAGPGAEALLRVFARGEAEIREGSLALAGPLEPAAVLPLRLAGNVVGVISVLCVFEQKLAFTATDRALFELLSSRAAGALAGAFLFGAGGGAFPKPADLLAYVNATIASADRREPI